MRPLGVDDSSMPKGPPLNVEAVVDLSMKIGNSVRLRLALLLRCAGNVLTHTS